MMLILMLLFTISSYFMLLVSPGVGLFSWHPVALPFQSSFLNVISGFT